MRPIEGYEGVYSVNSEGEVFSHRYGKCKKLKKQEQGTGYKVVYLYSDKGRETVLIHRLVAQAFICNPLGKPDVNHKDSCRHNNHVTNLEWCTPKENTAHAILEGNLNQNGSNSVMAKLTEEEVVNIRKEKIEGVSTSLLAEKYKVSTSLIRMIHHRKIWKHV